MLVSQLFQVFYWAWILTEISLQIFTRTRRRGTPQDRGSLWVLLPVIFVSVWASFWYSATHPHNMPGADAWVRVIALVLMTAGLVLRWTAVLTLGRMFSTNVAIHHAHVLRTSGLYRWVRHPSYSAMLVIFAALGLWQRNWVSLLILLLFPTAALLYRIHVEERALALAFGDSYSEYRRTTRRLVPGIY